MIYPSEQPIQIQQNESIQIEVKNTKVEKKIKNAISISMGFGGQAAAILMRQI